MNFRVKRAVASLGMALVGFLLVSGKAEGQVPRPSYTYFQPVPIYSLKRSFTPTTSPANPGLTKRWDSEVSRRWCDDQATFLPPGSVDDFCNDYNVSTSVLDGTMGQLPSQHLMPRQMDFASWFSWPWCAIRVTMGTGATATKAASAGWDFTQDGMGFTYTGCYGLYEPVAAPIVKADGGKAQMLVANSGSDQRDDTKDNVIPYLPGYLDPINLAFNVDTLDTGDIAISLVAGNFFSENYQMHDKFLGGIFSAVFAMGDLVGRFMSSVVPKFADFLGTSDVAILTRKVSGTDTVGQVSFIENRGLMKSTQCITDAFASCTGSTGTCHDPIHAWNASCQECMTDTANPSFNTIKNAMNSCPRTIAYEQPDLSASFALRGTKDVVFIGKYPIIKGGGSSFGSSASGLSTKTDFSVKNGGPLWLLVVVNRGPVNCFPTDGSLRLRNPYVKAADGTFENAPAPDDPDASVVDIHDTQGLIYDKGGTDHTVSPGDPEAERCGYLTFYTVKKDPSTAAISVDAIELPSGDVLKVPVGYNPTSFDIGDFNGDGIQDIVVANTGDQKNDIAGSISVIHCYPDAEPASAQPGVLACRNGLVEKDFAIGTPTLTTTGLNSRHPWWVVARTFKSHVIDTNNNNAADDGEFLIQYGETDPKIPIIPSDLAVTFIDSKDTAKGDFLVLMNKMDAAAAKGGGYRFWNDVNLGGVAIETNALHDATVKRLASPWSLFPVAITANAFNSSYKRDQVGMDVILSNFMSEVLQGYSLELTDSLRSECQEILVGLNNSHKALSYRNGKGNDKITLHLKAVDASGNPTDLPMQVRPCTGTFTTVSPGASATQRNDYIHDTTTPIYNAGTEQGDGNWGAVHLDLSWVNAGTERHGFDGEPTYLSASPDFKKYNLDAQLDTTLDMGAVNGAVMKLAEWPVETPSAAPDMNPYSLPNDSCNRDESEIVSAVHATKGFGGPAEDDGSFIIDAGNDQPQPHRCAQRHGMTNPGSGDIGLKYLRGLKAEACCLIFDEPTNSKYVNLPVPNCPEDPMKCCVMQMPSSISISSHYDLNPVTNAAFNASNCKCLAEREALDKAKDEGDLTAIAAAASKLSCCVDPASCVDPTCVDKDGKPLPPPFDSCCAKGDWSTCTGKACVKADGTTPLDAPYFGCCTSGDWSSCFPSTTDKTCDDMPEPFRGCCKSADAVGDHDNKLDLPEPGAPASSAEIIAFFAQEACFPKNDPRDPGDDGSTTEACNNSITVIAGAGSTVNLSNINQCCQVVNLEGSTVTSVFQACSNTPDQCKTSDLLTGDVPSWCNTACDANPTMPGCEKPKTTEALAPASCECAPADPKDTVGGETFSLTAAGKPTPFNCKYKAPSADGPLAMSAATSLVIDVDNPFMTNTSDKAKSATLPTTSDTFVVYAPLLENWTDKPDYESKVHAKLVTIDGIPTSSAECDVVAKLGIQGGGSASGCRLDAQGGEEGRLASLAGSALILALFGLVRRRAAVKRVTKK